MLKRLPLALVVGLVVQALFDAVRVVHYLHVSDMTSWET
jgi:hypothetical protein